MNTIPKKPKLVESWRDSWTKWSQKVNVIIASLPLAWVTMPEDWRSEVPRGWVLVFVFLGMANFLLSNLKQKNRP